MTLKELQEAAYANSKAKGFWEPNIDFRLQLSQKLCLLHSEVSEALEALRDVEAVEVSGDGKPEGWGPELADIAIRLGDLAEATAVNLDFEVTRKMAYNATRPHKHGKNF